MKRTHRTEPLRREWFYAIRGDGKVSSRAHLFAGSIAICSVNYLAGPRAVRPADKCRNCLRLKDAEVFR